MAIDIQMPKLSDNMESGTIIRWLKHEGDSVTAGEPLAEVETDKADVEIEAAQAGILREIRVAEGQSAAVGDVIAVLGSDAEAPRVTAHEQAKTPEGSRGKTDGAGTRSAEAQKTPAKEPPAAKAAAGGGQAAEPPAAAQTGNGETTEADGPDGEVREAPVKPSKAATPPAGTAPRARVRASPLAARIANEGGLDLSQVRGSGPGGRILKRDVEALLAQRQQSRPAPSGDGAAGTPAPAAAKRRPPVKPEAEKRDREGKGESEPAGAPGAGRLQEMSRMRLTIARRMAEANREIPHFYVTTEVDMTEAWRLRQALKASGTIPSLTVTHVIVKAVALALTEHPMVNASWRDGALEHYEDANIGIAVAVEDGLIVPVLHGAQELSLRDISVRAHALTEKARTGRFGGQDLTGATFTISNLGILDVDQFTAVITPPQAAVLAVGTVKERPVVQNGAVTVARTMHITMSCDHRVLNGVEGGEFLTEVKRLLEAPYVLLMEGS
jgi:pyruvate dehydrogenase E2 component (dihydrolipoamide acetyltransferase)